MLNFARLSKASVRPSRFLDGKRSQDDTDDNAEDNIIEFDCVGVNLTAIYLQDDELTDKETFQVEFEKTTDQWRLRTADDTYWILVESGNGIQTNGDARYPP